MLLAWHNYYCKHSHTTQSNLLIQYNLYPITRDTSHTPGTSNPKTYVPPPKTKTCQSNPDEPKASRRHHSPRLQAKLQGHRHQDCVALVPKQAVRPMEQSREPRSKLRHIWSIDLRQRRQEHKMGRSLFGKYFREAWAAVCTSMKPEHALRPCMTSRQPGMGSQQHKQKASRTGGGTGEGGGP